MSPHRGPTIFNRHPFWFALICMTIVVVPGYWTLQKTVDNLQRTNSCLVSWSVDYTKAVQQRDDVNQLARDALIERNKIILKFGSDSKRGKAATRRYQKTLWHIQHAAVANPYPEISSCLTPDQLKPVAYIFSKPKWDSFCLGKRVTIKGTRHDDVIHGTDGNDVIFAYSGSDVVLGYKGNDVICGRWGDDFISGGLNWDKVDCGAGDDVAIQAEYMKACE